MSDSSNGNGKGAPPIRTVRDGNLSSSIWEHQRQDDDGMFYSAKIVRNWQDDKGQWHESSSFSENDLRRIPALAENTSDIIQAHRYTQELPDRVQQRAEQKASYQESRKPESAPAPQPKQRIKAS